MNGAKDEKAKSRPRLRIRLFLTLIVFAEIIATVLLSLICVNIINRIFDISLQISNTIWIICFSVVIGMGIASVFNKKIAEPVTSLSEAMNGVAAGDFGIRLETESNVKEIRDIYESFNLMVEDLGSTEIIQTDFVSNVSHEVKTPINAIEGYAMLLQESRDETEQREYIDKILVNTKRLSELAGNILLLSRVENQSGRIEKRKYRLDEQIRASIVSLEPKWAEKEIEFDVNLDSIEYEGCEQLMLHVWNNLLGNAIKFNPQGGFIRMRLREDKEKIIFTIDDSGPGIEEKDKKHIFDRFYQSDTSRKGEGNGLGLSLVKTILDVSEGSVKVENLPEAGCRFTVILPKASNFSAKSAEK